jgi:hypothetical protein
MTVTPTCPEYSQLHTNEPLIELYRANSAALGRPVAAPGPHRRVTCSTDMGNVSLTVPSIHPLVAVSPPEVALHTADFAGWAVSPDGQRGMRDGAMAMAMTAVDVWLRPEAAEEIRAAFVSEP